MVPVLSSRLVRTDVMVRLGSSPWSTFAHMAAAPDNAFAVRQALPLEVPARTMLSLAWFTSMAVTLPAPPLGQVVAPLPALKSPEMGIQELAPSVV